MGLLWARGLTLQVGHVLAVAQVVGLVAGEADEFGLGEADLVGEVFEQFLGAAVIIGDGDFGLGIKHLLGLGADGTGNGFWCWLRCGKNQARLRLKRAARRASLAATASEQNSAMERK